MYPATAAHSSPMSVYRSGLGIRQAFLRNTSATASQQASMLPAPKLTTTSVAAAPERRRQRFAADDAATVR